MLLVGKLGDKNFWYHAYQFSGLDDAIEIIRIGGSFEIFGLDNASIHYRDNLFSAVLSSLRIVKKHKIVVCFGYRWTGIIFGLLNIFLRKNLFIVCVGTDVYTLASKKAIRSILNVRAYIFPGEINKNRANLKEKVPSLLLPWVIPKYLPKGSFKKGLDWIMITRFDSNKNPEYGIKLFLLTQKNTDIELHLYGTGLSLKTLKSKYELEDRIKFLNFVDSKKISFSNYSVFLQTSKSEGLSLALIEALWLGLQPFTTIAGDEETVLGFDYKGYLTGDLSIDVNTVNAQLLRKESDIRHNLSQILNQYEKHEYARRESIKQVLSRT